jgi:hypothetical protein
MSCRAVASPFSLTSTMMFECGPLYTTWLVENRKKKEYVTHLKFGGIASCEALSILESLE